MQLKSASHLFFAATMIGMGIIGLATASFAPIWLPVPETMPGRQLLAYLCTFVTLACGGGLLARRSAAPAAFALFVFLLVWTALFKIPIIIRQPLVEVAYQSTGQNLVLIAAAWILFRQFQTDRMKPPAMPPDGDAGLRIAHLIYGLALVAFGLAQFIYSYLTVPLVPWWLPGPVFWADLTGSIYIIAGAALVAGLAARLMAAISALQITLITVLVWPTMMLTGQMTALYWGEASESWALTAGAWVVATSFEGQRWINRAGFGSFARRRFVSG
jgi:hypothetical protein